MHPRMAAHSEGHGIIERHGCERIDDRDRHRWPTRPFSALRPRIQFSSPHVHVRKASRDKWALALLEVFPTAFTPHSSLAATRASTMKAKFQKPKWREGAIEELNAAIEATNLAEKVSSIAQAKTVFRSVNTLLTLIGVCSLLLCCDLL